MLPMKVRVMGLKVALSSKMTQVKKKKMNNIAQGYVTVNGEMTFNNSTRVYISFRKSTIAKRQTITAKMNSNHML